MFMGQDNPIAASALGGVYNYKDGRTAPDTINVLLEYPSQFTATFEATLVPGIKGEGSRVLRALRDGCSSTARITNSTPRKKARSRSW